MKTSKVFLAASILSAIISIVLIFRNETYQPNSVDEISTYMEGQPVFMNPALSSTIELYRNKKRTRILAIGGGIFLLTLIAGLLMKKSEEKIDPEKNLNNLKQKKIITESEYKVALAKTAASKKIVKKQSDAKKSIDELTNLKNKNIISNEEYIEKLKKIRNSIS